MKTDKTKIDYIFNVGQSSDFGFIFNPDLIKTILTSNDKVIYTRSFVGSIASDINDITNYLEKLNVRKVLDLESAKTSSEYLYLFEDRSYLLIQEDSKKTKENYHMYLATTNPEHIKVFSYIKENYFSSNEKKKLFSIVENFGGLDIKNLGIASSPLIKENYSQEVNDDIDFIISSFNETIPNGRIAIISGEPGTGKTYLIKSILEKLDNICIFIPSNMIDTLSHPSMLSLLINIKSQYGKPITLIIEDGDLCLSSRKSSNVSIISSLLNFSDGMLGSIIDIRIIITSNIELKDIDEAIVRPGRLCKHVYVGLLDYEQANKIYQRLEQKDDVNLEDKKMYTLAEVYSIFKNEKLTPVKNTTKVSKNPIGFTI